MQTPMNIPVHTTATAIHNNIIVNTVNSNTKLNLILRKRFNAFAFIIFS